MSDAEVESLRDASYTPLESIATYIKILDAREKRIDELLAKRRYPGREQDLHDLFDQVSGIADELNDHLDMYSSQHRDVRKALPKLVLGTERWSTAVRSAPEDEAYKIVRRIALDTVQDSRELAERMQTELADYFKAHPEAAKSEKARADGRHDPAARDPE